MAHTADIITSIHQEIQDLKVNIATLQGKIDAVESLKERCGALGAVEQCEAKL